jgi:hypothetical protein
LSGNPRVAFCLDPDDATDFDLAAAEGGYSRLVSAILEADEKTRPHRDGQTFSEWLLESAEVTVAVALEPAVDEDAIREAEIARARAEGYREAMQDARHVVDAEWRRLHEAREAFEQEKAAIVARVNDEIDRRNRDRAAWEARLRAEGRTDLVAALRVYDGSGRLIEPLATAIRQQALALLDRGLEEKGKDDPEFLLEAAARFVRRTALCLGNPVVKEVIRRTAEGTTARFNLFDHVPRYRQPDGLYRLRLRGIAELLEALAQEQGRKTTGQVIDAVATAAPPPECRMSLPQLHRARGP